MSEQPNNKKQDDKSIEQVPAFFSYGLLTLKYGTLILVIGLAAKHFFG